VNPLPAVVTGTPPPAPTLEGATHLAVAAHAQLILRAGRDG